MADTKNFTPPAERSIPIGSLVLVTGVSGSIAAHIANQFLQYGYRVRGLLRNPGQSSWVNGMFKHYDERFEPFVVEDLVNDVAGWEKAVQGCSAIVHTISDTSLSPDKGSVFTTTLTTLHNALSAATKTPSIKRFTLLGSSFVVGTHQVGESPHYDSSSWDDNILPFVRSAKEPYPPGFGMAIYTASKVAQEQEFWEYSKRPDCHFTCNVVLAPTAIGKALDCEHQTSSTQGWVRGLYSGEYEILNMLPPHHFISFPDLALALLITTLSPTHTSTRLLAYASPFTVRSLVDIMVSAHSIRVAESRSRDPEHTFVSREAVTQNVDRSVVENGEFKAEVERWAGRGVWGLREAVEGNVEDLL